MKRRSRERLQVMERKFMYAVEGMEEVIREKDYVIEACRCVDM